MERRGKSVDTEGFVKMTDQKPNRPKKFETEPDEKVESDTADPHQEELQIDQIVSTKESEDPIILNNYPQGSYLK